MRITLLKDQRAEGLRPGAFNRVVNNLFHPIYGDRLHFEPDFGIFLASGFGIFCRLHNLSRLSDVLVSTLVSLAGGQGSNRYNTVLLVAW